MSDSETLNWKKIKLGDIAEEIRILYEPNEEEDLKYIGLKHIEQETLKLGGIGISSETKSTKKKFFQKDILFGTLRPYFRKVIKVGFSGVCSTDITVIRSKNNFEQDYLFYLISSPNFIDYATKISSGTRMPRAKWKTLCESEWFIPNTKTRIKISKFLSNFDNVIEMNDLRLKILKRIIEMVYKEWFIKFKFPGSSKHEMIVTKNGKIPKEWNFYPIGNVIDTLGGGTPSTKVEEYWNGNIHWYTPSDLTSSKTMFMNNSSKQITNLGLSKSSARLFPAYSVMMTSRATIGVVSINTLEACANQGFIICIPNEKLSNYYIYLWLKNNKKQITQFASGATFKEINKTSFRKLLILVPDNKTMNYFNKIINPFCKKIEILEKTNLILQKIRDLLIPKLIMGEITIK